VAELKKEYEDLTLYQKIILAVNGRVYLYDDTLPGWSRPAPFYGFKCPVHGYVVNSPQGWDEDLFCPDCKRGAESQGVEETAK
jgi:hypothetical protein